MNLNISKPMFKCDLCQCPCYFNTWHTHWVLELNFTNSTNGDWLNNWSEKIHLQHFHLLLKIVAHHLLTVKTLNKSLIWFGNVGKRTYFNSSAKFPEAYCKTELWKLSLLLLNFSHISLSAIPLQRGNFNWIFLEN